MLKGLAGNKGALRVTRKEPKSAVKEAHPVKSHSLPQIKTDEHPVTFSEDFSKILNAIPDNIILLNTDMKILWANRAASEKFGKEVSQLNGHHCYTSCCNIFTPCNNCPAIKSVQTGNEENAVVKTSDGKVWDIRAFPIRNKTGEIINIVEFARGVDISSFMSEYPGHRAPFSSIITRSKKMLPIFHYIEAIASSEKPVCISGETGVGKELIARAIHDASGLKGTFVTVNVAGLDDTMFSDTLFGHRKGAFTGAEKERKGLILRAHEGTLLLDEFGDLSDSSQVKLLRLLEDHTYYPLGSDNLEKSNARIIATTNRNLKERIEEGRFREDLYYRLRTYYIHIPPLRERLEDVPRLLDHFVEEAAIFFKKKRPSYPSELVTLLTNYNFPGNVRELKAMVYDGVARHRSGKLSMETFKSYMKKEGFYSKSGSLPEYPAGKPFFNNSQKIPTLKEAEVYLISEALESANGNQSIAASLLGITRSALNHRLKKISRIHKPE